MSSVSSTLSSLKPAGIEQYRGAVYSSNFYKDPSDPQWRDDAAMKAYKERLAKYCSGCDPNDSKITNGWVDAEMLERAIQAMNAPTRRALMDSVRNLKDLEIPMLLPGIKVTTTPDDPYPFEAMQVMQFQGGGWKLVGNVIDVSGRRG